MAGLLFAAFIGLATIACIGVVIWGSIGAVFGRRSPWQPPPCGSAGWRQRWAGHLLYGLVLGILFGLLCVPRSGTEAYAGQQSKR